MTKFYKIKSFTDPKKEYTVRQFDNGLWRCDCPIFVFKERKGDCKHIIEAKSSHQKTSEI